MNAKPIPEASALLRLFAAAVLAVLVASLVVIPASMSAADDVGPTGTNSKAAPPATAGGAEQPAQVLRAAAEEGV